jgi:hypothetical protein
MSKQSFDEALRVAKLKGTAFVNVDSLERSFVLSDEGIAQLKQLIRMHLPEKDPYKPDEWDEALDDVEKGLGL